MVINKYMEIGKQIKKARKARDVTQKQLGEAIGFSEAHISYIETGKRNISVDKIKQIETILKCDFRILSGEFILFETKADKLYEILKYIFGTPRNYKEITRIWER